MKEFKEYWIEAEASEEKRLVLNTNKHQEYELFFKRTDLKELP